VNLQETIRKFKFKGPAIAIAAPSEWEKEFIRLGFKTRLGGTPSANTVVFVKDKDSFLRFLRADLKQIEFDSVLWFAYPKGTSGVKTDVNRDIIREIGEEFRITTVAAISIDDTWSALRFRPIDKVGT